MSNSVSQPMKRRKFLKVAGITLGASAAACCGLGALATIQPQVDLIEEHIKGENKMGKHILVAYASKAGSTGEVAKVMGQVLAEQGAVVDVYPVDAVPNVQDYQAVMIGSAVRQGRWLRAATQFVESQQSYLSQVPTVYFTVCMGLSEESEQKRNEALSTMDSVRSIVKPVAAEAFAGKMDYSKLSFFDRTMVKMIGVPEGDFRQWEAIRAWAGSLQLL